VPESVRSLLQAVVVFALVLAAGSATAETVAPYSGTLTADTGKPFKPFVKALRAAIKKNKFNIVGLACANCAAKSQGVTIPGNRVFLFFRPDYAVRMLAASTAAGIEAPIRVYVTETSGHTAQVTYRLPSHVFGAYQVTALTEMGKELDGRVAKIIADASAATK
jgi:uncharacterized protein (DUF302 family)